MSIIPSRPRMWGNAGRAFTSLRLAHTCSRVLQLLNHLLSHLDEALLVIPHVS